MNWNNLLPYSPAIISLLKGVVKTSDKTWDVIKKYEPELNAFFESIGIEVKIRDENGYAYLSQPTNDELEHETKLTIKEKTGFMTMDRLIRREALSDEQALLCVLLRERLEENEIIIRKDIYILLKDFYKEVLDKEKQYKEFDNVIRQMLRLNFLTELKKDDDEMESIFKIEKILTDKIDIDKIDEIKNKIVKKYAAI